MPYGIVHVSALMLAVFLSGWTTDRTFHFFQTLDLGLLSLLRHDNSPWGATLLSWLEPPMGACCCGMDAFDEDGFDFNTKRNSYTYTENNEKQLFYPTKTHRKADDNTGGCAARTKTPSPHQQQQLAPLSTRQNGMLQTFLDDFDLFFLLTSSFQIYWIYKMVVWRGFKRKKENGQKPTQPPWLDPWTNKKAEEYETEIEELAKTVEYLNRRNRKQEFELQEKDAAIDKLSIALEKAERQSTPPRSPGFANRAYGDHGSSPTHTAYYQLQVPLDDTTFDDEPNCFSYFNMDRNDIGLRVKTDIYCKLD